MDKQKEWVEKKIQIGKVFNYKLNGEEYWSSVGIQLHQGVYKVYIDVIREDKMDSEEYEVEEYLFFDDIDEAFSHIEYTAGVSIRDLKPTKGQKIFNPDFIKPL